MRFSLFFLFSFVFLFSSFFLSLEKKGFLEKRVYAARLKDIAHIRGVRNNQLVGYGLVVGLDGTGDGGLEYTNKSLQRMLGSLGIKVGEEALPSESVAAVLVTASLPPFARSGNKIDATVHVFGKASSLKGGTLIQTPLRAADEQVYAVAQGRLLVGHSKKGSKMVAKLSQGAIIEKEMGEDFVNRKRYYLHLHHPDFTTAARVVKRINMDLGGIYAKALDAATIDISPPKSFEGRGVELLSIIESMDVSPDVKARVVVNEKTGTVVIGKNVQISSVAISYDNLSLSVGKSQGRKRRRKGKHQREDKKEKNSIILVEESVSVEEVVKGLNRLGVSSRDLIAIFQNIQAAGALQGELEVL